MKHKKKQNNSLFVVLIIAILIGSFFLFNSGESKDNKNGEDTGENDTTPSCEIYSDTTKVFSENIIDGFIGEKGLPNIGDVTIIWNQFGTDVQTSYSKPGGSYSIQNAHVGKGILVFQKQRYKSCTHEIDFTGGLRKITVNLIKE